MTIPDCSNCAHGSPSAWRCKVFKDDVTIGETASCTAFRAADRNGVNDALLSSLEEIIEYEGGSESALHDEYVMERARAAIRAAKNEECASLRTRLAEAEREREKARETLRVTRKERDVSVAYWSDMFTKAEQRGRGLETADRRATEAEAEIARLTAAIKHIADGNIGPSIGFARRILDGATVTEAHMAEPARYAALVRKES